jgi:hypothetical protein
MSITGVEDYLNYFRQLAVSHKDLRHNVAGENGDCPPGSVRFTKISVDQVLKALNNKIGFPCLCVELYEIDTKAEIVYDVKEKPRGAFIVVDHPINDSPAAEEACYIKAERITREILQQIWKHHYDAGVDRCNTPFKDFDFNKLSIVPVGPLFTNEHGYRTEFDFSMRVDETLAQAPAEGTFL